VFILKPDSGGIFERILSHNKTWFSSVIKIH